MQRCFKDSGIRVERLRGRVRQDHSLSHPAANTTLVVLIPALTESAVLQIIFSNSERQETRRADGSCDVVCTIKMDELHFQ